jgi:hypothetical protein
LPPWFCAWLTVCLSCLLLACFAFFTFDHYFATLAHAPCLITLLLFLFVICPTLFVFSRFSSPATALSTLCRQRPSPRPTFSSIDPWANPNTRWQVREILTLRPLLTHPPEPLTLGPILTALTTLTAVMLYFSPKCRGYAEWQNVITGEESF